MCVDRFPFNPGYHRMSVSPLICKRLFAFAVLLVGGSTAIAADKELRTFDRHELANV
jgi:hypothetical protein